MRVIKQYESPPESGMSRPAYATYSLWRDSMNCNSYIAGKRPVLVVGRAKPLLEDSELSKEEQINLAWEDKEYHEQVLRWELEGHA